jgi:hypothetical protein
MRYAKELAQQGLELAQTLDDRPSEVTALVALGNTALLQGDVVEARKNYEACGKKLEESSAIRP